MQSRTKITILGGFLGSGKTTLLNELIRATDEPLAVIVNDFGSINVDAQLIGGHESIEGEVALQNGCICCSIRGDLLDAVRTMVRRPSPPRHIVIETSGVSDPIAVARTFLHPQVAELVLLSTIIVCVDPTEFNLLTESQWKLASDQVRAADFVVLTKCDVATRSERIAARAVLKNISTDLRVLESSRDEMPTDLVIDSPRIWRNLFADWEVRESAHVHEVGGHHHHHHDGPAFETWTFRSERPMSLYGLRRALRKLPKEVFRAKGFVYAAEDQATKVVMQVAGRRAELSEVGAWAEGEAATEIVFLGAEGSLDPAKLQELLESCASDRVASTEGFMDEMLGFFNRMLSGLPQH